MKRNVVIMGAAGRDFHNFNVLYRDREDVQVVAFTATQIPDIEGRRYPSQLAGPRYPEGIPILAERELPELLDRQRVDEVVFSYSDVSHQYVMERASEVIARGADFRLLGTRDPGSKAPTTAFLVPGDSRAVEAALKLSHLTSSSLMMIDLDGKEHPALVREKQRDYLKNRLYTRLKKRYRCCQAG